MALLSVWYEIMTYYWIYIKPIKVYCEIFILLFIVVKATNIVVFGTIARDRSTITPFISWGVGVGRHNRMLLRSWYTFEHCPQSTKIGRPLQSSENF